MTLENFDLEEPAIAKKDIMIVEDHYFKPENVCIVTGASSGIGRATAPAPSAT